MNRFALPPKLLAITSGPEVVIGHYVYEWYDNEILFYIGMGTNRRAWNQHLDYIENIRIASDYFHVKIVRHGLTKPTAHAFERNWTQFRERCGAQLVNKKIKSSN